MGGFDVTPKYNAIVATKWSDILLFDRDVVKTDLVAVDTETDGTHQHCKMIGISFAFSETTGIYIPFYQYNVEKQSLEEFWDKDTKPHVVGIVTKWLQAKKLIMHNAVFDIRVIYQNLGIWTLPLVHADTMFLAHTVYNEEGPLGLKPLATLLVDSKASAPQNDVKESVKKNGGTVTKTHYEMYKCDVTILGRYAAFDTMYTFGIYNRLYPELDKQLLRPLWEKEVMPLLETTYWLNNHGVKIDVEYFKTLRQDMQVNIQSLEEKLYTDLAPLVHKYEVKKVLNALTITARSAVGKELIMRDYATVRETRELSGKVLKSGKPGYKTKKELILKEANKKEIDEFLREYYKREMEVERIFNLDSGDDKGFLLYEVLGLPCTEFTKTGKPSTSAATLADFELSGNATVKLLLQRSKERKLLTTYVEPIIEKHVNGYIYTGFNQTGTTSGRYSSSKPINLQTLPRDDKRIKKGFIPREGKVFIGADYESLEPKIFAEISNESSIKQVYKDGLDLYSQVAIRVFGRNDLSADPNAPNFVKTVEPDLRSLMKIITLAVPYGASPFRLHQIMNCTYERAEEIYNRYMEAFPNLRSWMADSDDQIINNGFVLSLSGRKRRAPLSNKIQRKYRVNNFHKRTFRYLMDKYKKVEGYTDPDELYFACRNNRNNGRNFQIQSLAASVSNAACIDFYKRIKELNISNTKIALVIHDEIVLECNKEDADKVALILKDVMENNWITKMISVKMKTDPIITDKNLGEAK